MNRQVFDVIVVGGGVAGSAAALRAAQYYLDVAWIRGDRGTAKASRGKYVFNIDNMIGIHPDLMLDKVKKHLKGEDFEPARTALEQAHFHIGTQDILENAADRIQRDYAECSRLIDEKAVGVERDGDAFVVRTESGEEFVTRNLILATGVMDAQPKIKKAAKSGKIVDDIRWIFPYANYERLLYCIRCEGHLTANTPTAVIGAGEAAGQIAMMLKERYASEVHLLLNGEKADMQADTVRLLDAYEVVRHPARLVDLLDDPTAKKGTDLHGFLLEDGSTVTARFALVAMGLHRVYNELAVQLDAELEPGVDATERAHVLVEDYSSETSVRGLFAVGDMAKRRDGGPSMKQVYTAQEFAVRAVDTIDRRRRSAQRQAILQGG